MPVTLSGRGGLTALGARGTTTARLSGSGRATALAAVATTRATLSGRGAVQSLAASVTPSALLTIDIGNLGATVSRPTVVVATPAGQHTEYSVVAVDQNGTRYAEFVNAEVSGITWELNGPGDAHFSIPIDDTNVAELPLARAATVPHREVQIWRNGHLLWWGVPIKRRADSRNRRWEYTASGLLWYFTRRYMGEAERGNFITNPEAEDGTNGWTVDSIVATASTDQHILGTNSFRLWNPFHVGGGHMSQSHIIEAGTIGLALWAIAWVYVPAPAGFETWTPNPFGIGLALQRYDPGGVLVDVEFAPLNFSIDTNKWVRREVVLHIPPNVTARIDLVLYAPQIVPPNDYVYYDAIQLVAMESAAFGGPFPDNGPWDQIEIGKEIVRYAQGGGGFAYDAVGDHNGKSNLNIGVQGAPSGIIQYRIYDFAAHQRIYSGNPGGSGVLDEWPARADGYDFDIEYFPPNIRTWTPYYPDKGTARTYRLVWGENISDYTVNEDLAQSANQIVVLGDPQNSADRRNSAREEGGYENAASLGGLTLEHVESAPNDSPIDTLDNLARVRGTQLERAALIPSITVFEPRSASTGEVLVPLIGVLAVGDTVPVVIDDADVQINATYRIIRIELDPTQETLELTMNEEDIGEPE